MHHMTDTAGETSAAIGATVRAQRHARNLTLDQLALTTGVSRRMLINVEQGRANPSVATLLRISDALGIGLPALVSVPRPKPVKVTPNGHGAVLWTGPGGGRGVLVAGTEPPDVLELWDWTLAPGDEHDSEPHAPGTRELLQVHEGHVTLDVADETVTLEPGDSVAFAGDVTHRYANQRTIAARFSLAVFEPGVGASPKASSGHA
ncbi:XRE family transcriptional regulator [Nocardioides sp.]|uniref:helix-turn-helix domain-containing protein n=1 Tax=Nocardioides sp. TaxID=35761 RepID=UPI00286E1912|nr:XRE family transcriptional regulator [Nocardioides sp.]